MNFKKIADTSFKFSLLITLSTTNVERGFSVLGLSATKQ